MSCPECHGHLDLSSFHAHHRWSTINTEVADDVVVCPSGHPVRYGDLLANGSKAGASPSTDTLHRADRNQMVGSTDH